MRTGCIVRSIASDKFAASDSVVAFIDKSSLQLLTCE